MDDGLSLCADCGDLGFGVYCGGCGALLHPQLQACDHCQTRGSGAFCHACGQALRSTFGDRIDAGTFDWQAWRESLAPFLGGLTPRELALLEQG
jgi:hypothetical protein